MKRILLFLSFMLITSFCLMQCSKKEEKPPTHTDYTKIGINARIGPDYMYDSVSHITAYLNRLNDSATQVSLVLGNLVNYKTYLIVRVQGYYQIVDYQTQEIYSFTGPHEEILSPWWDCMTASWATLTGDFLGQVTCGLNPELCLTACLIHCSGKSTKN